MRLIAFILLANLMVFVSSPHFDSAGMAAHDCPSCPVGMVELEDSEADNMHQGPSCAGMFLCAPLALIVDAVSHRDGDFLGHRHAWPDAYKGASIRLALNLPPPRA